MLVITLLIIALLAYLGMRETLEPIEKPNKAESRVAFVSLNDVYRINGVRRGAEGGMARLANIRNSLAKAGYEIIVLHAGDLLAPSLLSEMYKGKQMIDIMNLLDGEDRPGSLDQMYVTFGNHEFDSSSCVKPDALIKRVEESQFYWLASNLDFDKCADTGGAGFDGVENAANVIDSRVFKAGGITFGLFGITIEESSYADLLDAAKDDYTEFARQMTASLKADGAEFVIAVTHLNKTDDKMILDTLGEQGPDLIVGGHDHVKMEYHSANGRSYYKQTADARDIGVFKFNKKDAVVTYSYESVPLAGSAADPTIQRSVDAWLKRHEEAYCKKEGLLDKCLDEALGMTLVPWELEEVKNREQETVIGNWFADQLLKTTVPDIGKCNSTATPKVALIGSGGLRLNFDLPENYQVQRREIAELFTYSTPIIAACTTGAVLHSNLANGLGKPGAGRWPHTAGMKITYSGAALGDKATIHEVKTLQGNVIENDDRPVWVFANSYVAAGGPVDEYDWGICEKDEAWNNCADRILLAPSDVAAAAQKDGKNFDLKTWMLENFSGKSSIGPDTSTTTGRLVQR